MKYFMIEGIEAKTSLSEEEIAAIKEKHIAYLHEQCEKGVTLFSGPKIGAVGGCIVMKAESYEGAVEFVNNDPNGIAGLREYRINEFNPHEMQNFLKDWFD